MGWPPTRSEVSVGTVDTGITVLCVDDEPIFLELMKAYLTRDERLFVECEPSPEIGLEKLRTHRYDAVVCDFDMPVMNGIELLKSIRAMGLDIPFILFTGKGRESIAVDALNNGADFYIQKSTDSKSQFEELNHLIHNLVESRRAKDIGKQHLELLERVMDTSIVGVLAFDRDFRINIWNPGMIRITELSESQALGRNVFDIVPSLGVSDQGANIKGTINGEATEADDVPFFVPGSSKSLVVELYNSPIYDAAGAIMGGLSVVIDRTKRHDALAVLEMTSRKYSTLFQHLGDPVFVTDLNGSILDVNDAAVGHLGCSRDELLKMTISSFTTPQFAMTTPVRVRNLLRQSHAVYDSEHVRKDGSVVPVRISSRVVDFDGEQAILSTVRDVSHTKKTQADLQMAQKKLDLLGRITRHDIRNHVAVLSANLFLIEDSLKDPAMKKYLEAARGAYMRIVTQLDFAGQYQKTGTLEPTWVNLNEAMARAMLSVDLGAVLVEEDLDGLELFVDPMFEMVFHNLIINSLKHGHHVKTIAISHEFLEDSLIVVYEDDGIGIDHDVKNRLFELGGARAGGMGMFLVKEILGMTDISILENGEPGKGARFEMIVPKSRFRPKVS